MTNFELVQQAIENELLSAKPVMDAKYGAPTVDEFMGYHDYINTVYKRSPQAFKMMVELRVEGLINGNTIKDSDRTYRQALNVVTKKLFNK